MTESIFPQTKEAQKLKPFSGEIPFYLVPIMEAARQAGMMPVAMEGHHYSRKTLEIIFAGERKQIRKYGLIAEGFKLNFPKNAIRPTQLALRLDTPTRISARIYRIQDKRFSVRIACEQPDKSETLFGGKIEKLVFYEGDDCGGERHVFIGCRDDLLKSGTVSKAFFDAAGEDGAGRCHEYETIEELVPWAGGLWAYSNLPFREEKIREREQRQQQNEAECGEVNYDHPEEWLESIEDILVDYVRRVCAFCVRGVANKGGARYTIERSQVAHFQNAVESALQGIRDLRVTVTRWDGASEGRKKAAAAQADAGFQRFMQRLQPDK